jgi:L-lactate dehydrogenase complex protein LldG
VNARDAILSALRRAAPPRVPLPDAAPGIVYPDPERQFAEMVAAVGGKFLRVPDLAALNLELGEIEAYAQAKQVASLVPGAGIATVDLSAVKDPHELGGLDFSVLPGEFGVAENGAVWIPGRALGPHRAVFVVCQHLALVVSAGQIVNNMQEAYARLVIERPGYGLFISGPSKTADIEQALVIGAHGARSCTVFVVG